MSEKAMPSIEIYTTRFCPYCSAAKALLKRKGVRFYTGRLTRLKLNAAGDELIPEVSAPASAAWYPKGPIPEDKTKESDPKETDFSCDQSDFFVMAIPFEEASRQVWEAYRVAER